MAADFHHAETERGVRVDDPTESALRTVIGGLDDTDDTFVVVEADGSDWYASVAVADGGGYEVELRDPAHGEHVVAVRTDLDALARDLVLWLARRAVPVPAGHTAPRPDVAGLALLAGLDPAGGTPLLPWEEAQRVAGLRVPGDYRAFVDLFGPGEFHGWLAVVHPRRPHDAGAWADLVRGLDEEIGTTFRQMRERSADLCPYPVHPAPGGLLPWATTCGGDHCFWLTEDDDPDRWPVIVWLRGTLHDPWRRYDMGMARFLLLAFSRQDEALDALVRSRAPFWRPDPTW